MNFKYIISLFFLTVFTLTILLWAKKSSHSNNYEFSSQVIESKRPMEEIIVSGTLRSEGESELYFGCNGIVESVFVKPGQIVKKGELLAKAQCKDVYTSYDSKINDIVSSEKIKLKYEKQLVSIERLKKIGYYSEFESLEERSKVLNLLVKLRQIDEQNNKALSDLKSQVIIAPNAGVVSSLNIRVGMKTDGAKDREPLVVIIPKRSSKLALLEVQDFNINSIKLGQSVQINIPGNFKELLEAKVININKRETDDLRKRYYLVTAKLNSKINEDLFKSGMKVESIVTVSDTKELLWIPRSAIEIEVPQHLVVESLNLANDTSFSSSLADTEKLEQINSGVISRSIASTLKNNKVKKSYLYIINSQHKITKVTVAIERMSRDFVGVRHDQLEGQSVLTHYQVKNNWLKDLSL